MKYTNTKWSHFNGSPDYQKGFDAIDWNDNEKDIVIETTDEDIEEIQNEEDITVKIDLT